MKQTLVGWICAVILAVVVLAVATGTKGELIYLLPDSLEIQIQSEITVFMGALPIYRSPLRTADNVLLTHIRDEGHVVPLPSDGRRLSLAHWNSAWKDGYAPLARVFFQDQKAVLVWSKADRERAALYWSKGFALLRSINQDDRLVGSQILRECWRCETIQDLTKEIAVLKGSFKDSRQ